MHLPLPILAATSLVASIIASSAAVTMTGVESGGDVVFTGGGTLNVDALTLDGSLGGFAFVRPTPSALVVGTGTYVSYTSASITVPDPLGPGTTAFNPVTFPGDDFGVINGVGGDAFILVPNGYTSGASLSGSMTLVGTDFATVGLTPGTYTWSWGTGPTADSFTVIIAPEPSGSLLALIALAGGLLIRRRSSPGFGIKNRP